jgi:hypothetical protein
MNSKPDNKCERGGDIILLSEIITNSRYWQEITTPASPCNRLSDYYNVVLLVNS